MPRTAVQVLLGELLSTAPFVALFVAGPALGVWLSLTGLQEALERAISTDCAFASSSSRERR